MINLLAHEEVVHNNVVSSLLHTLSSGPLAIITVTVLVATVFYVTVRLLQPKELATVTIEEENENE